MSELNFRSDFFGTKDDLVMEIERFEANFPDLYLLHRKKNGAPLPVTPRRIQQYCDEGIIDRPLSIEGEEAAKGRYFNKRHLVAYLAAIRIKKSGQPVSNLAGLLAGKSEVELTGTTRTITMPLPCRLAAAWQVSLSWRIQTIICLRNTRA